MSTIELEREADLYASPESAVGAGLHAGFCDGAEWLAARIMERIRQRWEDKLAGTDEITFDEIQRIINELIGGKDETKV